MNVAVVGAGPAGLMAARTLRAAGASVTVFDKGRRPGGRVNTREHDDRRFDHGAQYFTVRDPRIRPHLDSWLDRGVVAEWDGTLVHIDGEGLRNAEAAARYVAVPGMVDLALDLSDGLDVRTGVRIGAAVRGGSGWRLHDDEGRDRGAFDGLVIAVPAPQAVPLLTAVPALRAVVETVEMAPCWAGMLVFDARPPFPFDGAFLADEVFSWIARDASKPGRPAHRSWVVHATPEWTRTHWNTDRADIPAAMCRELEYRFGRLPDLVFSRAHRWGYALADGAPVGILHDAESRIGICGDWCVGGRVEGALISGLEIAERMLV